MSQKAIFAGYFKHLAAIARQGDAREESFYSALAAMLKAVADDSGRQHVHVTTLPKPTEGGNPDFRLWNGTDRIIGYVGAKRPVALRRAFRNPRKQIRLAARTTGTAPSGRR